MAPVNRGAGSRNPVPSLDSRPVVYTQGQEESVAGFPPEKRTSEYGVASNGHIFMITATTLFTPGSEFLYNSSIISRGKRFSERVFETKMTKQENKHRLKRKELVRNIFFIFSEEYEKSDADTIWDIKLPVETLITHLKEHYKAQYTKSMWIRTQIRRYEREIGERLFDFTGKGKSEGDYIISINRKMNAFRQHHHLYITYKIKIANGIYGNIQNFIASRKPDRPLNILLGSGTNPYFVANIIAGKSWTREERYNIYTHNLGIIKKLCNSRINSERIKIFSPAGRINLHKQTIMGDDNSLYRSVEFDFIIQSTQYLYEGTLFVDNEEEIYRKRDILDHCTGTKILALVKDELIDKPREGMVAYGSLNQYDFIITPQTRSNKKRKYDFLFEQYEKQLDAEIVNWNYLIHRVKKD